MKERILDIGIGSGGEYIKRNTTPNELRFGLDVYSQRIANLMDRYPEVLPVIGDAEHLPFRDNTFKRIDFILPFEDLVFPALQNDSFYLPSMYMAEFQEKYPQGWYNEFQRVLIPNGEIVIFGDAWIEPHYVKNTSQGLFNLEQVKWLTLDEFRELGTDSVNIVINENQKKPSLGIFGHWTNKLVELHLRSTKPSNRDLFETE